MPVTPTYPGIYIQEAPSTSHTIIAAPTNIVVFIGYCHPLKTTVPAGQATQIFGFPDYQRAFGGFVQSAAFANQAYDLASPDNNVGDLALAVNQFFLNQGTTAYVVGLALDTEYLSLPPAPLNLSGFLFSQLEITDEIYGMTVQIISVGGNGTAASPFTADVIVTYGPQSGNTVAPIVTGPGTKVEVYRMVNLVPGDPNNILTRINGVSTLVTLALGSPPPTDFSAFSGSPPSGPQIFPVLLSQGVKFFDPSDFTAVLQPDTSLDKVPVMNLMVIPGVSNNLVISTAIAFCERRLAFLIADPQITDSADGTLGGDFSNPIQNTVSGATQPRSKNAALYFPYLLSNDPISGSTTNLVTGQPYEVPPAPTVAGIFAATDVARGVWKAPAGFAANTSNTNGVVARGKMTDSRQGVLNPLSVNCLRDFANVGTVVFGSRTLASTYDQQWTYVPVRRMALFLEQTFLANLKWVIFEPNAEPLWTAITMSLKAFMLGLFKQGAFAGTTPSNSFMVQCDSQTTTPADIDAGVVNIIVSFAPLKPAEFVIITIAQMAGQTQTS